jgi:PAS domain S-box-containing protein
MPSPAGKSAGKPDPESPEVPADPRCTVPPVSWERPERFLYDIVDAMADPLFVKDEQHRWITVNAEFCKFMGHAREEILGKSDYDFFPRAEAETFWKKDAEVFRTGAVNINEEPFTDASGKTHVIVTKKAVFTDASGRKILVGTIRDVTERKRMEEALRQARDELELRVEQRTREAEEAQANLRQAQKLQTVGQLTGGVAHDFNNILAIIAGNLELIKVRWPHDRDLHALVGSAISATERGAALTQRLLAFSRKQALQPRPTHVDVLLSTMLDLLRRSLGEPVEVEMLLGSRPCCCFTDPAQLEAALLNLCVNARDAMPGGGKLTIEATTVSLSREFTAQHDLGPGRYVLVEVTDTGEGMSPETLERAFEPFFTTKDVGKGSGLGLSMVYGFAKQSRGHVMISSAVGRGTTVKLFLPECTDQEAVGHALGPDADVDHPIGSGEAVLLVEDDPNVRAMTVQLVQGLGYEVHQAASVREALELVRTLGRIDLLLTDVVLGGRESGQEVAEAIQQARPEAGILFMSGYTDNALGSQWLDRSVPILHKPFRRVELARALRAALTSRG